MTEADPTLASIAARFPDLDVAKSRGGYTVIDPSTDTPLARLKLIPQTDRFELFYWSLVRERWRTFGDFGTLRPTLDRAHEIFRMPVPRDNAAGSQARCTADQARPSVVSHA
jgi:hypothetical protein